MKKIFSLLIFAALMIWTWNVIHTQSAIGFETHSGIQLRLSETIRESLLAKKPDMRDFEILRMWTENIGERKVRAFFTYRFKEQVNGEDLFQKIEGEAVLERKPSEETPGETDIWLLQEFKTTNDSISFEQGTVITPKPGPDEQDEQEKTSPTEESNSAAPAHTNTEEHK